MSYETDMIYLLSELDSIKRRLQFQERLGTGLGAGWNGVSGWSYASATTITVPSGAASIYAVGDQVRLKQGGAYKYFSVVTVADTLLTVTGGSDFSVADLTITDAAFSKGGGVGHPGWFNLGTPTWTTSDAAFTNQPVNNTWKFILNKNLLLLYGQAQCHATSGGTGVFTATWTDGYLPDRLVTAVGSSMNYNTFTYGFCYNNNFNLIRLAKYDGTTLATNSQYFGASLAFEI